VIRLRFLSFFTMVALVAGLGGVAGAALSARPRGTPPVAVQPPLVVSSAQSSPASPVAAAVARVRPAVVNISTERTVAKPFTDFRQFFGAGAGVPIAADRSWTRRAR
jgi:S1-C subfamily serine protease